MFLPLALVGRELERMSRADADLFVPHVAVEAADAMDVVAGVAVAEFSGCSAANVASSRSGRRFAERRGIDHAFG